MNQKNIGVIGLGAMGKPMAKNLLKAGYSLTVYDLNPEPIEELVAHGAKGARSSAETAGDVEVIITMLPACDEVKAAIVGAGGVLEGAREVHCATHLETGCIRGSQNWREIPRCSCFGWCHCCRE